MRKWFANLKIGRRMAVGFLIMAVTCGVIGGVGIMSLIKTNVSYSTAYSGSVSALKMVERISSSFQRTRTSLYGIVLSDSAKDKQSYSTLLYQYRDIMLENITQYQALLEGFDDEATAEEKQLLDVLYNKLTEYGEKRDSFIESTAMDTSQRSAAFGLLAPQGELGILAQETDNAIRDLIEYNDRYSYQQIQSNVSSAYASIIVMVIILIVSLVLAIIVGIYVARSISKPVSELVKAAGQLAVGDISVNIKADTKDEIGELMHAFGKMADNIREQALMSEQIANGNLTVTVNVHSEKDLLGSKLAEMVNSNNSLFSGIKFAADQVSSGALQLSSASQNLAQGSGEQASSVEEISSSIEEITGMTRQNAENAKNARDIVISAKNHADNGNGRMQEMTKAMEAINKSSINIYKIIKVIDDIAFQTNILALNAAVEAARAGAAGKGFAVVAEEVRNLAAKSADAAKETTSLIEDNIEKVKGGSEIANDAAEYFINIISAITHGTELVQDIVTASEEQAHSIEQISTGIEQVAQVVHTTSATAEETASVSEQLAAQAQELKAIVAQVKLRSQEHEDKPLRLEKAEPFEMPAYMGDLVGAKY